MLVFTTSCPRSCRERLFQNRQLQRTVASLCRYKSPQCQQVGHQKEDAGLFVPVKPTKRLVPHTRFDHSAETPVFPDRNSFFPTKLSLLPSKMHHALGVSIPTHKLPRRFFVLSTHPSSQQHVKSDMVENVTAQSIHCSLARCNQQVVEFRMLPLELLRICTSKTLLSPLLPHCPLFLLSSRLVWRPQLIDAEDFTLGPERD